MNRAATEPGFLITITSDLDDALQLHQSWVREEYGADGLADALSAHLRQLRGDIWAADNVTITIKHTDPTAADR
jgi:hypothetical protein